ncbi:helix-turn-helix domain-containing protein [Candidatus Poribacteria bacterium]
MSAMEKESPAFEDEFLTTKQIADALKKNLGTIQRWCREGKLPAAKIEGTYIVRRVDFDDWFSSKQSAIQLSSDDQLMQA